MTAKAIAELPTSRGEAKALGSNIYFTGTACPQGHNSTRRTHNGECCECGREKARQRAQFVPKDQKRQINRAYRTRNRDSISERRRRRWAENPKRNLEAEAKWNSGPGKEYKRKWTRANKDRVNAKARDWKRANAEKVKAAKADYYLRNPHIGRLEAHRRRARIANAEGFFTQEDVDRIFKSQNGRCACCGKKRGLTIDHIVPLAKGGSNWPSNIQGLCLSCNCSKQAKDEGEYRRSLGMLL